MSSVAPIAAAQLPRNVYKLRGTFMGLNAYFAYTSTGQIVGSCIYLVSENENDAQLVRRLRGDLDRVDPQRPVLRLLPRTVTPAIDGPSHSHPQLQAEREEPSLDEPAELLGADNITSDVYRSLYAALYGSRRV